MRLAFSTLGCPDWTLKEIYATAKDLGFDGIEIRGLQNELYMPKAFPFNPEHINTTISDFNKSKTKISMLTTGICVGLKEYKEYNQACEYIDLASKLSVPYIRILITDKPQPEESDIINAAKRYSEICEYAKDKNVTPLIETNGVLADTKLMNDFMNMVESENKGVLWDVHHPFRFFGESAKDTYNNIGNYIKYVHVKDSVMADNKITYRMMGYGDVPNYDAISLLKSKGYDGYICLEWVKRWNPELESAGIVFAHFISYMEYLLKK